MRKNPLILANRNHYSVVENYEKIDWHDYEFMKYEAQRVGLGEQGKSVTLNDAEDITLDEKLFEIEGLRVLLNDKISVNRSLPDVRHEKYFFVPDFIYCFNFQSILIFRCKTKLYLKHLHTCQ